MTQAWRLGLALVLVIAATGVVWAQVGMKASTLLQASTTAVGQPIQFPQGRNQFTGVLIELAPGGEVGRHMHPYPNYVYVLSGQITIEIDGQPSRVYSAGESFAESTSTWHNGVNRGQVPVAILVVFAGEEGKPVTVRP